jgi:pimeloyl-ACP methyl ester carboxylesterase
MTIRAVTRGDLVFDVVESGPADGEPVLLLHGFPQHASSWRAVTPLLAERGYRTLAMDQRGYSPGARPRGRRAYRIPELVADAVAVIDQLAEGGPVHLVGHDWGAAVTWALAGAHPERVAGLTAVSVPHTGAFFGSMVRSQQWLTSWYMGFFQLPVIPERLLARRYAAVLTRSGQSPEHARQDAAEFAGPSSFTGPLNWYRALPLIDPRPAFEPVRRPALFVWSDRDDFVTRAAAERCGRYVQASYRFETLPGVSHWIPDAAPAELVALLLPHLAACRGTPGGS